MKAQTLFRQRRLDEAIPLFRQAVEADPEHPMLRSALSQAWATLMSCCARRSLQAMMPTGLRSALSQAESAAA